MAMIGKVLRMHRRDKKSVREIVKATSLARNTVRKYLRTDRVGEPRRSLREEAPIKLAPFVEAIKQALLVDARRPKKERRTAKALLEQISEAGYEGGYSRLTDFIREWRLQQGGVASGKAFVPLAFELGEAFQFDWSEEGLVIGGIYRRLQVAHMKLCASRAFWLVAYPSQGHEMLFDAHTRSFAALGGVARRGIYDNMRTAIDKVLKGKGRVVNARFAVMCAHYLYDPDFCNVASGWEKGVVEKNVQDSRRRVWIDARQMRFGSIDELNAWVGERCRQLWTEVKHPEHKQFSVAEMLEHERLQMMPMPAAFDGYVEEVARCQQHLPGDGGRQPLLGAVRAGRADAQHPAVPDAGHGRGRRRDRRRSPAAHGQGQDPLRLASLHPAARTQARRIAQRRAVRRPARAVAANAPSTVARDRR